MMSWIRETLTSFQTGTLSTKRHIIVASAAVLCLVSLILGLSCAAWVWRHGDLGAGAVGALTCALGILAGLAGAAYRKKEVGVEAPPAPGVPASASVGNPEGAKIGGCCD